MQSKTWYEMTHPFPNFNGYTYTNTVLDSILVSAAKVSILQNLHSGLDQNHSSVHDKQRSVDVNFFTQVTASC